MCLSTPYPTLPRKSPMATRGISCPMALAHEFSLAALESLQFRLPCSEQLLLCVRLQAVFFCSVLFYCSPQAGLKTNYERPCENCYFGLLTATRSLKRIYRQIFSLFPFKCPKYELPPPQVRLKRKIHKSTL